MKSETSKHTILKVHAKIHEVDAPWTDLVNEVLEIPIGRLVRDVLDHDGSPHVLAGLDGLYIQPVLLAYRVV